ncbi:hypothetical protein, partial [Chitinophaga sp.]|uniref:hypothetical protein n=1 Tax=Chitinophaga sp. TaxID=1869181 RepID=UPI00261AF60E
RHGDGSAGQQEGAGGKEDAFLYHKQTWVLKMPRKTTAVAQNKGKIPSPAGRLSKNENLPRHRRSGARQYGKHKWLHDERIDDGEDGRFGQGLVECF